ncbi:hypothetical protein [Helicobacter turcicus]|uniref:Uncharacterized protein n=1 Tax=Helicobacter turcicus TaxID=2867412 RepID=A0ABS7JPI9_9HELI|nr:hypothetical protein [Helicobacter turcicus]MBX7491277.1 hypothetical protein [Helicobacter turcicus]MBX7546084.1 hypothetical protein [Helicobacter turcicus]
MKQEKRGIVNVTFNAKRATPIQKDIEAVENAVITYIAMYVRGFHSTRKDRGLGAEHIKLHLEKGSEGETTLEELLNLGNSLRVYLKNFDEPFIDEKEAKIYEWENKEKVRFRAIADRIRGEGDNCHSSPSNDIIITFYSDRNLSQRMEFKNPKVKAYYENTQSQTSILNQAHKRKQK